jgi:hypothetical protein
MALGALKVITVVGVLATVKLDYVFANFVGSTKSIIGAGHM